MGMICEVNEIANLFSWGWAEGFCTDRKQMQDALSANGLDPRQAKQLCDRHTFVRAVIDWIEGRTGGSYDSKTSRTIASKIPEDKNSKSGELVFQIDAKMVDLFAGNPEVKFIRECTITLCKGSGHIRCTDATVEATIRAKYDWHKEARWAADVNRVIGRIMKTSLGVSGLIPWNGRGTYLVLSSHFGQLDKVCAFVKALGGTTSREGKFQHIPYLGTASHPIVPVGSKPRDDVAAVADAILADLDVKKFAAREKLQRILKGEWKREGCKANLQRELKEEMYNLKNELQYYRDSFGNGFEEMADHFAFVSRELAVSMGETGEVSQPIVTVEQAEIDTVLEFEPIAPTVSTLPDVRKGERPQPGCDYLDDNGQVCRAPKNPLMFADTMELFFPTATAA